MKHFGHTTAQERVPYQAQIVERPEVVHFRCRCGRLVPDDMMLDLGPSGTIPAPLDELARGDRYRCDGCWRRWLLRGAISVEELRELTEQPPPHSGRQAF